MRVVTGNAKIRAFGLSGIAKFIARIIARWIESHWIKETDLETRTALGLYSYDIATCNLEKRPDCWSIAIR